MLILSRKETESIYIGDDIKITVTKIIGGHVRIGINAPDEIPVHREEVYNQILESGIKRDNNPEHPYECA